MTRQQEIIIKTSPVVFLRRLIFIEFFFAIAITAFFWWQADLIKQYAGYQSAPPDSFSLVLSLVIATIQVFIIIIAFLTWYLDTYLADQARIVFRRGNFFGESDVALTQDITDISVKQSSMGATFNYGTLELSTRGADRKRKLKNIPNPDRYADEIKKLIAPRKIDVERHLRQPVPEIITAGEGQYLEFKSSLSWDYRRQRINKDLNKAVMKNVVAFMNTTGGVVFIGVDDEGKILGLEKKLNSLGKPNVDGYENVFNMAFNKMVGVEFSSFVTVGFDEIDGKTVCRIVVSPAPQPVYLNHNNKEEFYIRTGNSSQPLTVSQAIQYVQTHFEP